MTSLVDEMVGNQKVVQAFGYGDRALERFDEINCRLQEVSLKAIFFSSITNPSTRFVNGLVYAGVGIVGAFTAIGGVISVGQLSCFLSYASQYTKPFNEISSVVTELQNAFACAKRVFDFDRWRRRRSRIPGTPLLWGRRTAAFEAGECLFFV